MKNETKLKKIANYVVRKTGSDIKIISRDREVVYARALYYMIALKDTKSSLKNIGVIVDRDHATVHHARKKTFHLIEEDRFYMNIYREYFGMELEFDEIREIDNEILTDNEKLYRGLSDEEKAIYDDRASLVLKSFAWKHKDDNRKEVFEQIYIGM